MTFKEHFQLFVEQYKNKPLIAIDIQPAHKDHCKYLMPDFIKALNAHEGAIVIFFNDEEVGADDEWQVKEWYLEYGLEEEKLDSMYFIPKQYAFFRNWMDLGMAFDDVMQGVKYLISKGENDSREIPDEEWAALYENDENILDIVGKDCIYLPHFDFQKLKRYHGCYLCGGGREECLAEMRILFDAMDIEYELIQELIY